MSRLLQPLIILSFIFSAAPGIARADVPAIEVSPLFIEEEARIRDIFEYKIKVRNNAKPYRVQIYPLVNDIVDTAGSQTVIDFSTGLDREMHLSRWMSFSRGLINLDNGQEAALDVKINVDPGAKAGKYRAALIFSEGPNRPEAEANAKRLSQPQVIFDIEVKEDVVERSEIKTYRPEREMNLSLPVRLLLEVRNIGNRDIMPGGAIYVYNRRNQEVSRLALNPDGRTVGPEQVADFSQSWAAPKAFGRYKAKLELDYGSQDRQLTDTVYFWVLPWRVIAFFSIVILALLVIALVFNFRRRAYAAPSAGGQDERDAAAGEELSGVINLRRK